METYQVPRRHLPLTLYRVDYPGARATYSKRQGFQAAGTFTPQQFTGLRRAVEYHLNWHSKVPSPFISAFRNKQHALNWANIWRRNNKNKKCCITEMKVYADDDVVLFRLGYLVDKLGISTELHPSQYQSEYLFFRHIPSEVIEDRYAIPAGTSCDHVQDSVAHY